MSREIAPEDRITWGEFLRVMQSDVDPELKPALKNASLVVKGWEKRPKEKKRKPGSQDFWECSKCVFASFWYQASRACRSKAQGFHAP